MSPVAGSIATSAASSPGRCRRSSPLATARSAASCTAGRNDVCTCQSGGLSPPNSLRNCWRRNSFAHPARTSFGCRYGWMRGRAPRAASSCAGGDEPLRAHLREHEVAALERAVVVRPRRQRRRRANQPGDERRLRQRERPRRLAEQMLRHRLDAVDARAQIDAVQIELEDLLLGQLRFDQQRDAAFLDLAAEGPDVGEEQRARELLRQRAAAFDPAAAADVAHDRAPEADRIDAGMMVEAAILDGDDGVLQVGRDLVERDVVPLLVEAEPRLAVRAVEHRVADAARQPMHRDGVARQPDAGDGGAADEQGQQRQREPVGPAARPQQAQRRSPGRPSPSALRSALLLQPRVGQRNPEDHDDDAERERTSGSRTRRSPRRAGTRSAA